MRGTRYILLGATPSSPLGLLKANYLANLAILSGLVYITEQVSRLVHGAAQPVRCEEVEVFEFA